MCKNKIHYLHDCESCKSLGDFTYQNTDYDLYFCLQFEKIPTVIARYGNEGSEYFSGLNLTAPVLVEAQRRAEENGYLPTQKKLIEVKAIDSVGDIFVKGLDGYINNEIAADSLQQLLKNYETAFGEPPTKEMLEAAFKFVEMFLAEVGETAPKTEYANAVSRLSWIINSDNIIETADNLASIRTLNLKNI